jgi:hypothetical protein
VFNSIDFLIGGEFVTGTAEDDLLANGPADAEDERVEVAAGLAENGELQDGPAAGEQSIIACECYIVACICVER